MNELLSVYKAQIVIQIDEGLQRESGRDIASNDMVMFYVLYCDVAPKQDHRLPHVIRNNNNNFPT